MALLEPKGSGPAIGGSVPKTFIISSQNFMCNSVFRSEQNCLNTAQVSSCSFRLTHRTGLGGVAQSILKMMTLPHIASKPCMLKASEMSPAATVSNTCDVSSSTAGIKAVRLSMDTLVEGES